MYHHHISSVFSEVNGSEFHDHIQGLIKSDVRYRDNLTLYPDYDGFQCYINDARTAGFALSRAKDESLGRELINVFSTVTGTGAFAVKQAVEQEERLWLTCFSGLEKFYGRFGFQTIEVEDNWCYGGPDVLKMSLIRNVIK